MRGAKVHIVLSVLADQTATALGISLAGTFESRYQNALGGDTKMVFATNSGLTKSALVMMDGRLKPFISWHHTKGERMADISCLLRQYPFVSSFCAKVEDAARTGRYGMRVTDEYRGYLRTPEGNANLNLKFESARGFTGLEQLIEEQFLIVSAKYAVG
jgi:hypothetical protein